MNNLENNSIVKEININKNHIDNFVLETDKGTKRVKDKFHKDAVIEKNSYVNKQNVLFSKYKVLLENEMVNRLRRIMPNDKSNEYDKQSKNVDKLFELVKLNCNISDSFKLKLDFIISSINDDTSLDELNDLLKKFIDKFTSCNIQLTVNDFKYTMFTEQYMHSYFLNADMGVVFEKIYFKCPDIKLQLKMSLYDIVNKYSKSIHEYILNYQNEVYSENDVLKSNVIDKYISLRTDLGEKISRDEYYNTMIFVDGKRKISDYLENSAARIKNYNTFVDDYSKLDDFSRNGYDSATMGLYLTLNELKKYYKYEFIILELLKRYKDREKAKTDISLKKKEIEKEEKNRLSIYNKYLRANGIGFLAKKDEVKEKNSMLEMNEEIKKLDKLYNEYNDLEITNNLNELNESSTIYDLFLISLSSFSFIESMFKNNEDFSNLDFNNCVDEYFKFIFNPNNNFLRKTNALVEFDITKIISDKYKLLDLNLNENMISKDAIDATMDTLSFINIIQNINKSNISLDVIDTICKMKKCVPKENNDEVI